MKITEEQKQQLINLNDSRVNEILGVKNLEVGKWYKDKECRGIYYITSVLKDRFYFYGFNDDGLWVNDYWYLINRCKLEPSTHEEVKTALIAEAKRRYKRGDKVKCVSKTYYNEIAEIDMKSFRFYTNDNDIWVSSEVERCNVCIFNNGKWAEVIEKPNKQEIINQINELLNLL